MKNIIYVILHRLIEIGLFKKTIRRFLMNSRQVKFSTLIELGALQRPGHAYCLHNAAQLAKRLGIDEISAIEFGVAGGVTLLILEDYCDRIKEETGVAIKLWGFDTGQGMPDISDPRDLPFWFKQSQFSMDFDKLSGKLRNAELVIGDIEESKDRFFSEKNPPLIGALIIDVDIFSSTMSILKLIESDVERFLPRLHVYADDVVGTNMEMYGEYNGEILAFSEFNKRENNIRIHLNRNLIPFGIYDFRYHIFYGHLFGHSMYNRYIGNENQEKIETLLSLK